MTFKKNQQTIIWRVLLLFTVLLGLVLIPIPARAALSILSVQPNTVSNANTVQLVVTGTDFQNGSSVVIEQVGALPTSFVSSTVLSALLPSGLIPGIYTVTVVNPDASSVSLSNSLTVTGAQETPVVTPGSGIDRPLLVVDSYTTNKDDSSGKPATLTVRLRNKGQTAAYNVTAVFTPGDLIPLQTGGVLAIYQIEPREVKKVVQPFSLSIEAMSKRYASVVMAVTYTGSSGTAYSETFNLNILIPRPLFSGVAPTPTPTPTQTAIPNLRPQVIIKSYETDPVQLEPGFQFYLRLKAENVGKSTAQRVSMILGGGSSSGGNSGQGTPDTGGISGGNSSLSTFAPLNASNVQYLGDMAVGAEKDIEVLLIVNTSTLPGAYSLPISFTYIGPNGGTFTDDQSITLLVYTPPNLNVNFYRDPGPLYTNQPNLLPIQVVNLGRTAVVLGNMTISAENAFMENNTTLVGPLDPGGYYTLDTMLTTDQPGPMDLMVEIDFTDDFNQPNVYTATIPIEVLEAPVIEPETGQIDGENGEIPTSGETQPETFWQKVLRFFRGLFGLDSAQPTPVVPTEMPIPGESQPMPAPQVVPISPKG
jgi:hypothetical protein